MITKSFKELIVWQKSMLLVKELYKTTRKMPPEELYVLISQMRRAAVSIPSNIAEGRQRSSRKDFSHFLRIADGSASEIETQVLIAKDLYPAIKFEIIESLLDEIQKMLASMLKKLSLPQSS